MDTLTRHHTGTTKMPLHEVAQYLLDRLGPTLVAYMADTRSRAMPPKWAKPPAVAGHAAPSDVKAQRVKLAHTVFTVIADADDEYVARSWLISANPRLDGATPADLIRNNDAKTVYAAAEAFINDDYYA